MSERITKDNIANTFTVYQKVMIDAGVPLDVAARWSVREIGMSYSIVTIDPDSGAASHTLYLGSTKREAWDTLRCAIATLRLLAQHTGR